MIPLKFRQQIQELLSRGVEKIIFREELERQLLRGEKLRLKLGIDPTGADLHIGHMVAIRKLREFQRLGHQVIIIVGDYTAQIGDPSGRDKMREPLTKEQVHENLKTYQKQIGKILDLEKTEFRYQSEWFDKMGWAEVIRLASIFTLQQMSERDMYQKRIKAGNSVSFHETMYPLMQGYDSVAIKADVEFGGSDQEFNLLAGRTIQSDYGQKPQHIFTTSLLLGLDGRKMSKTYYNYIGVMESPNEMYGKVMSAIDEVIVDYFKLATDVPISEVSEIEQGLKDGSLNPRDIKACLAREIVAIYHDRRTARSAEQEFEKIFKHRGKPSEMPVFKAQRSKYLIADLLVESGLVKSKNEARRLIEQKGVKVSDVVIDDWQKEVKVQGEMVVQVGKRRFMKVVSTFDL